MKRPIKGVSINIRVVKITIHTLNPVTGSRKSLIFFDDIDGLIRFELHLSSKHRATKPDYSSTLSP